jgi:serine/threonine protein kinase
MKAQGIAVGKGGRDPTGARAAACRGMVASFVMSTGAANQLDLVLLQEISGGTFAQLYLAETRAGGLDRIVAVKILRDQWSEHDEILRRTRDEARLLARLRHKNIVRVEDLTTLNGRLAIIMEYVEGVDLKQLVDHLVASGGAVPARVALQIAVASASALEAAWQRVPLGLSEPLQVVHRDIKPSNIMVSAEGEVKVLDFGTARSTQAMRSAQTGAIRFGSLKYMSPERREGDRGIHVADVYAVGLVLLELLRSAWLPLLPLDAADHDAAVREHVAALPDLGLPNADWDRALRGVLVQVLSADPALRPDAEQFARTLRAYADSATGPTLESFAADAVAPLLAKRPRVGAAGNLTGTRIFLEESDSDNAVARRAQSADAASLPPSEPTSPSGAVTPPADTTAAPRGTPVSASGPAVTTVAPRTPPPSSRTVVPESDDEATRILSTEEGRAPAPVFPSKPLPVHAGATPPEPEDAAPPPGETTIRGQAPVLVQPPLAAPPGRGQHVASPGPGATPRAPTPKAPTPAATRAEPPAPRVEPFVPPPAPSSNPAAPTAPSVLPPVVQPFVVSGPTVPTPQPPVAQAAAGAHLDPDAPAPRYRRFQPIVVVAVCAALVAIVAVAGAAAFILRPASPALDAPPPAVTAREAGGGGGAPVRVDVTGGAQWVRLELGGEKRAEGRGGLDAAVLAGRYTLVVKQVGRGAVRGEVQVPPGGLQIRCTPADSALTCSGGAALTLR